MGYCPVCGIEVPAPSNVRFGETLCSQAHAEEFVARVQAARIQAAAAFETSSAAAPKQRDWKHYLKMGVCLGAPLLALAFLLGSGGAVLGAAGVLFPILAFLACPLAMYFMMRSMSKTGQMQHGQDQGEQKGKEQ